MSTWDELTEEQKVEAVRARYRRGHTSVARHTAQQLSDARERAFDEAISWLAANGFGEASAALEQAAFEVA